MEEINSQRLAKLNVVVVKNLKKETQSHRLGFFFSWNGHRHQRLRHENAFECAVPSRINMPLNFNSGVLLRRSEIGTAAKGTHRNFCIVELDKSRGFKVKLAVSHYHVFFLIEFGRIETAG